MSMLQLFLSICAIAAGLVILVLIAIFFIDRAVKFLSKEEEEREREEYYQLKKNEDEELFL